MAQQSSAGIFAQSLSGSGGVAGAGTAGGTLFAVSLGGNGAAGGAGGPVTISADIDAASAAAGVTSVPVRRRGCGVMPPEN